MHGKNVIISIAIVSIMIFSAIGAGTLLIKQNIDTIPKQNIAYHKSYDQDILQENDDTTPKKGSVDRDDAIILINESFENEFPPIGWTNNGWLDSLHGMSHTGSNWSYSWAGDEAKDIDVMKTGILSFGNDTELRFWYAAESSSHPMDLEVHCLSNRDNGVLVFSDENFTHTAYEEVVVDLSMFTGECMIQFSGLTSDFYGQMIDDVLITTDPLSTDTQPPEIENIIAQPNPQIINGTVNISCDVTDDVSVDVVKVNITGPYGSSINFTMLDDYYFNLPCTQTGPYSFFIWANDTSDNRNMSDVHTFEIIDEPDELPPFEVEKLVWNGSAWVKTADVYFGEKVYFKVNITNPYDNYTIDFSGMVQDDLPDNLCYIEHSSNIYSITDSPNLEYYDKINHTVYWRKPAPILPGDSLVFRYEAMACGCGVGINNLTVAPDTLIPDDPYLYSIENENGSLNISDSATVNVICIDQSELVLQKSVKIDCDTPYRTDGYVITPEDTHWVTFNITISSIGPFDAVVISDELPDSFVFNETWSVIHGWTLPNIGPGGTLYWNRTNVPDGWSETIQFRADIEDEVCDNVTNIAMAKGEKQGISDVYESDSVWVNVLCNNEPEYPDEGFMVIKKVKPDCIGISYDNHISFDFTEYEHVLYKIDVYTDESLLNLSIRDNLPQLQGLLFNETYVEDGEGYLIPDDMYDFKITDEFLFWNFTYVPSNTHYTIFYCADVDGCGLYENVVNASGFYYDGGPCCPDWKYAEDTASVDIICPSGIMMDKEVSKDGTSWKDTSLDSTIGDTIWFKLKIKNLGFEPEYGVHINDYLPSFLTLKTIIDDDGAEEISITNQTLHWFYQQINGYDTKVIIFQAKVIDIGHGENIACVSYYCNESNNEWCDSVWINVDEGIHLEKTVSQNGQNWKDHITAKTGDRIWWNITISHYSLNTSLIFYNIIINDTLPNKVTYVPNSAMLYHSDGWSKPVNPVISGSVLTWDLSTIETPHQAVLEYGERLTIHFATDIGLVSAALIENYVNVTGKRCNNSILFAEDNATVLISDTALMKAEKTVRKNINDAWEDEIDAEIGDIVSFNISLTNLGTFPMYKIGLWDELPTSLEYIDGSAELIFNGTMYDCQPETTGSNVIFWDDICTCIPSDDPFETEGTYLMPGKMATITFGAEVIAAGVAENLVYFNATMYPQGLEIETYDTAIVDASLLPLEADAGPTKNGYVDEQIYISGSADGGLPPYTYLWDLDDDGEFDDATGKDIQKIWSNAGSYTIRLKVIDDQGNEDTDSALVIISNRKPNLYGQGSLQWVNITPGDTITGTFTIRNNGDPESKLNWEVIDYPDWGTWSFSPESGNDLTPEDGDITITASIDVPRQKNKEYTGVITVVNKDDTSDSVDITIALATPKIKDNSLLDLWLSFLENHPIFEQLFYRIINQIL